ADIVISTIPVNEVLLIPVVTISPLLTDAELVKIRNAIDKLRGRRSDAPQNRVVEIMDIVRKYSKIEDESLLAQALEKQLYGKVQDSWRRNLMLTDMITEDRIRVGVSAEDKEDAVRKVGQLLVEGQLASPGYVDAMIRLMNELGAYIVIAPGVAMPHARSEDGAKKTGLAILVPNKPVVFGHQKNDPVRIILALVATDNKSHLQAMRELSTLISREEILEEVILSKTPEELLNRIKQFEEQYVKKG
ncbi:MAG: PTS sugar transporter subunit IIA, partial [Caldicoprobacterales bacterium]